MEAARDSFVVQMIVTHYYRLKTGGASETETPETMELERV